jgi:hypothetical protein
MSGAVGITVFKTNITPNNNKLSNMSIHPDLIPTHKIYLFYDDHSTDKYCVDSDVFISDLLLNIVNVMKCKDYNILVEEPFKRDKNLKYLWSDSQHLNKFLDVYFKIKTSCNMYSVDIRNSLVYCSLDALIMGLTEYDISFYKFIYPILYFYDIKYDVEENRQNKIFCDNLEIIKNVFMDYVDKMDNLYKPKMEKIINALKNKIIIFMNKYAKYNHIKIMNCLNIEEFINNNDLIKGYPFVTQEMPWQSEFNIIIDTTMELFTLALLLSNIKKINVIYMGLSHCSTLSYYLKNIFNFNVVHEDGVNESTIKNIQNTNETKFDNIKSCINIK